MINIKERSGKEHDACHSAGKGLLSMRKSVILMLCIVLLNAFVGCGTKSNKDDSAEKTLQVVIDAETVARIDLYWNYRSYTVRREDSSSLIDNAIELLNGAYVVYAKWTNSGTGSGDHIGIYDSEGNVLKTFYIFKSEDGPFSIWEEGTEHFSYQRDDRQDNLQDIVKMIAVEEYGIQVPYYQLW